MAPHRPARPEARAARSLDTVDCAQQVDGGLETLEGWGGMTDWLGMLAVPRTPRPELKGRVLARALTRRRRWPLAAAAVITMAVGGGAWWAYRAIGTLTAERDDL